MDRLNQLRGEAGCSRDSSLDTSSLPSEAYVTAAENSTKFFSLSDVDSSFDISPIKDVSLASATVDTEDQLISNLSPISKKSDLLDSYKIGKQIEAANILSGGVDIFEENDNSYDGDELIIDDNVESDERQSTDKVESSQFKSDTLTSDATNMATAKASKDSEVVLQIDGKNVHAIDIGNGLYLYRKDGEDELAAVQILDDDNHQQSFKFLKVRENLEGNLEVYEEIQIEVSKDVQNKEGKNTEKNMSHVPIKDISKVISDSTSNIVAEVKSKSPQSEIPVSPVNDTDVDLNKDISESKADTNLNTKMKFSDARKSPLIGSFTPMTYHSTPNKEGIPLTKTMVDRQLHPSRHSDNIKKTIEVHTESSKQKCVDSPNKTKDMSEECKPLETSVDKIRSSQIEVISCDQKTVDIKDVDENTRVENTCKGDASNFDKLVEKIHDSKAVPENRPSDNKTIQPCDKQLPQLDNCKSVKQDIVPQEKSGNHKESKKQEEETVNDDLGNITSINESAVSHVDGMELRNTAAETICTTKKNIEIDNSKRNITEVKDEKTLFDSKTANEKNVVLNKNPISDKKELGNENDNIIISEKIHDEITSKAESKIISETTSVPVKDHKLVINEQDNSETKTPDDSKAAHKESSKLETCKVTKEEKSSIDVMKTSVPVTIALTAKTTNIENSKTNISNRESNQVIEKPKVKEFIKSYSKSTNPLLNTTKTYTVAKCATDTVKDTKIQKDTDKHQALDANEKKVDSTTHLIKNAVTTSVTKSDTNVKFATNSNMVQNKLEVDKKEAVIPSKNNVPNPINNNHAAVPFGKWTEANRQEFLNKIKESKVPATASNGKQIKNSNDLNRRDVLKKIDSQRQTSIATAKAQEIANKAKSDIKKETPIFTNKSVNLEAKIIAKSDTGHKNKALINKKLPKQEIVPKQLPVPQTVTAATVSTSTSSTNINKKESLKRKEINNQDLIDKTIEGIINRSVPSKATQEDTNQNMSKETKEVSKGSPEDLESSTLDDIEMQMNKLHGIPFVERPPHELPQVATKPLKTYSKVEKDKAPVNKGNKLPNLIPFPNKSQQKVVKESVVDVDSEEEIIEHEPITGDIEVNIKNTSAKLATEKIAEPVTQSKDAPKKDAIITEKDFDKFARRNSITYENCLKVNFDGSEVHNVIQTVVEKDSINPCSKGLARSECNLPQKQESLNLITKLQPISKNCEDVNKSYHHSSRVKIAYQSAMTAKRQSERPITIIEDKPVKVVYMDSNADYFPNYLNVQGKDLVPIKKHTTDIDTAAISSCDSLDSEVIDCTDDKSQDEIKSKGKHQRKQVLTPVETPELELIEPQDLGFDLSPKKKRKTDDNKMDKSPKTVVPKKSYLLGRSTIVDDKVTKPSDLPLSTLKETHKIVEPIPARTDAASAIDSLVKAAALIETQSENNKTSITPDPDSQSITPVKRGRGRPRKYPLPEGETDKNRIPSPQKKPRLIDAKKKKADNDTEDDESSSDEIIKENWTMGKINENIVCPICSKLFRSENVVFKHVKHCTGPSPSRSDSDKRSPRRGRSQESESTDKFDDMEVEDTNMEKVVPKKRKSKDAISLKSDAAQDDIIVIEDTPIKEKPEKRDVKPQESRKATEHKASYKTSSLVCEFCGKTFRQLSYLVNHKLQHGKEESKKPGIAVQPVTNSVFSCEVCKKEFRKLHHLVQHRIIHNPSNMTARLSRKSSSEHRENKAEKAQNIKRIDDSSAGFRCEPCDKSFRKLHHLVEHRETHDGINRQKNTPTTQINSENKLQDTQPPPQCDICKKTFRKLHHLVEHKEQHVETSSEKSDDKSVKSSLSTKDIIHECSLCYMVFPNEHSLTKHTVICQRKKKQAATKPLEQSGETDKIEGNIVDADQNEIKKVETNSEEQIITEKNTNSKVEMVSDQKLIELEVVPMPEIKEKDKPQSLTVVGKEVPQQEPLKPANIEKEVKENIASKIQDKPVDIPIKIRRKTDENETSKNHNTPKRKMLKEKANTITKRPKSVNSLLPVIVDVKPEADSNDDDEIRYMLNPNFKVDGMTEGKVFMKVRAKKRNSLQIERPNSKDLVKRRISLQHPPKIPRLKAKPVEIKTLPAHSKIKNAPNATENNAVPLTDSDDSDVTYSFPKTKVEKHSKAVSYEASTKDEKKTPRKSLSGKRKSLTVIAKRKSLGQMTSLKHKVPLPVKPIKRRTAEVEHRCDCGQLFSSAALLSRHTSLAHTPPRIRRRRSPLPDADSKPGAKPRKSPAIPRKSTVKSAKSETSNSTSKKETRKSSANQSAVKTKTDNRKSIKSSEETVKNESAVKPRRRAAHRGVPVPEKMKKLMEKNKK